MTEAKQLVQNTHLDILNKAFWLWGCFMRGIVAVLMVASLSGLAGCGEQTPYERKVNTCSSKGEMLAAVMSQDGVRQTLRSPSTASFPSSGTASHNGDCTFNVSGRVDAQNGFGAVERRYYTGVIKYDHNSDTWQMRSVDLGE